MDKNDQKFGEASIQRGTKAINMHSFLAVEIAEKAPLLEMFQGWGTVQVFSLQLPVSPAPNTFLTLG